MILPRLNFKMDSGKIYHRQLTIEDNNTFVFMENKLKK